MTATIRWETHERDLLPLLGTVDDDVPPSPMLACFTDGAAGWLLLGRAERADEDIDPVTELAVVAAELNPDACVLATPVRVRDLDAPDTPVVARTWVLLSALRHGRGTQLRTRLLPVDGLGTASDLDVEASPAASVFDDAVRHRLDAAPPDVLEVACRWGNRVAVPTGVGTVPWTDEKLVAAPLSPPHEAERARHRLRRHAADLAARHRPTAPVERALDRPAVHADTPPGWLPACPV